MKTRAGWGAAALALALGAPAAAATQSARAELRRGDGTPAGTVTLTETPNGVLVAGQLRNLPPGPHAIHVHRTGACEPPSFESAGDHFDPEGVPHGFKSAAGPHAGDLPNIHVGQQGSVAFESLARGLRLTGSGGMLDRDGAAVVVHARPDDHASQPSGAAGDRIACGGVSAAKRRAADQ